MTVQLSSLRVTADMDVSSYTRGMAQKVAADKDGAASAKAVGAALGQMDAAAKATGDVTAKLSKQLIEGYSSAAKFEKTVRDVGRAVDTGLSLDRATVMLENVYRRFGLTADAAALAQQGVVSIVPAVEMLNTKLAVQSDLADRAAAATRRLAEAQSAQQRVNAALGIRDTFATTDRGADMEAAIRDAEREAVALRKARDEAEAFNRALLGIRDDFGGEARAKDIEAWSRELDQYLANLVRVRAEEERIARERRVASQNTINTSLGVRAPMSDAAYGARASEYEDLGRSIDNLRARYDPLYAAEKKHAEAIADINRLYAMGEVDAERYADVLRRANVVHDQTILSLKNGSAEIGLNRHQWQNLGFQINDVATMLMSGSSPMQVLATQSGQVIQIMQTGQGGVVGSLKSIGTTILGLITPVNLIVGGLVSIGVAAVASYASWINAQAEVERSLLGIGRASGATVGQINAVAEAYAAAGNVSVSVARQMASTFAGTGRISPELFGDAITSAKDFAKVLGTDTAAAAGKLATALADPARGVEQLNETLGAFDAGTIDRIRSLTAQNRAMEAQQLILAGVRGATESAERATTGWSRTWDSLGRSISNVWGSIGQAIDAATGNVPLENQQAALEARLKQIEDARAKEAAHLKQLQDWGYSSDQIKAEIPALGALDRMYQAVNASLQKVTAELQKGAEQAKLLRANLESLRAMGEIKIVMPEIDMKRVLGDRASFLGAVAEDPVMIQALGLTQADVTLAAARAKEMSESFMAAQDQAVKQAELANRAITARSPAERASIAAEQKRLELANAALSPEEKKVQIAQAYANALKEGTFALSEQEKARARGIRDQIGSTQAEIDGIGKTAEQAELLRLNWQTYADLRREAEQNNTAFDQAQYERLTRENAELARRNQLLRERQLYDDLAFEQSQLGRSSLDQTVASRLRSSGMPVDLNSQAAAAIRYTEEMKSARDATADFASTFLTDLAHGATVLDALSNALTRFADQLIKMATDQLVAQAFGGLLGRGGFSFGGGASPVLTGSGWTTGIFHSGGVVTNSPANTRAVSPWAFAGAERFHSGGIMGLGPRERPAVLELDEEVLRRDDPRHTFNGGRRALGDTITASLSPVFNIDASGSNMTEGQMQQIAMLSVVEWWKTARRDVVNVIREARAARVKGV